MTVDDNRVGPLYKHVFPPALAPSLSFIGLPWQVNNLYNVYDLASVNTFAAFIAYDLIVWLRCTQKKKKKKCSHWFNLVC